MDAKDTQIKLLLECLKKKERLLTQILNITENQGFILTSRISQEEIYAFFLKMNEEKQKLINDVVDLDKIFENVFKETGSYLDENTDKFNEEIKFMQDYIRNITDLDAAIRIQENVNNEGLNADKKARARKTDWKKKNKKRRASLENSGEYENKRVLKAYKRQIT